MIDFSLKQDQFDLVDRIKDFATKFLNDDVDGRDERKEFDLELWKKCGSIGLQGMSIPEEYGGWGLDAIDLVLGLEALGYASRDSGFNFSLAAHLLACAMPINEFGTEDQKRKWLPGMCNGEYLATNAMTEATPGSDVYHLSSTAKSFEGGYLLNGVKTFCSNGPVSNMAVTYASTDISKKAFGGISSFVLFNSIHKYKQTPAEHKLGLRTCQMGMIILEDTEVNLDYLLGKPGAGTVIFNRSMEWERICLGALHLGDMAFLLECVIKFCKTRSYGDGRTIGSFQAISHKVAELKTRLSSVRLLVLQAAWRLKEGKSVIQHAAMSKNAVSTLYKDFCLEVGQIYGGQVFRGHHDLERSLRHSIGATLYSGTTEVQHEIIARTLGIMR